MDAENNVRVGVRELRSKLTYYLDLARGGTTVVVTSRGSVVAELRPPPSRALPPRRGGMLKGQIRMAEDFDTWPDDIMESFEAAKF